MLSKILVFGFILVSLFQACGYVGNPESHSVNLYSVEQVDFKTAQALVFSNKCASCHSGASPIGNYDLSSYAGATAGGRVIPFDSQNSLLVKRMMDGTMPLATGLRR